MEGLEGLWPYVADIRTSIAFGVLMAILMARKIINGDGIFDERSRNCGAIIVVCISAYTFGVLAISQLVFKGPTVSELIHHGFGSERMAWIMLAVMGEQGFRVFLALQQLGRKKK